MITVDMNEVIELEKDLKTFASRAFPFATKNTINSAAFKARELAQRDIRVKFINRNKFTERSVLVDQVRTLNVRRQAAVVGSIAPYMADQEFGTVKRKTGSEGVPIQTGYSAGQENQQPRTRLPRKANKLANINLRNRRGKAKNRRQKVLVRVYNAIRTGKRFVFLELARKKGIFRVIGGSRKTKRGWPRGARLKQVVDMTESSVVIPRNPWLKPAVDTTQLLMPAMYKKALTFQLKRQGLFRG